MVRFFFVLVLLFSVWANAQTKPATPPLVLDIVKQQQVGVDALLDYTACDYLFRELKAMVTERRSIHLVNPTDSEWVIRSIEPSCGCTSIVKTAVLPPRSVLDIPFAISAPPTVGRFQHSVRFVSPQGVFTTSISGTVKDLFPASFVFLTYPPDVRENRANLHFSTLQGQPPKSISSDQPWLTAKLIEGGATLTVEEGKSGEAKLTLTNSDDTVETCRVVVHPGKLLSARPEALVGVRKANAREIQVRISNMTKSDLTLITKVEVVGTTLEPEDTLSFNQDLVVMKFAGLRQVDSIVNATLVVTADVGERRNQKIEVPLMILINK